MWSENKNFEVILRADYGDIDYGDIGVRRLVNRILGTSFLLTHLSVGSHKHRYSHNESTD
jgi:hypothetical protein